MGKYHMKKLEREITDSQGLFEILMQGKFVTIAMCRGNEPYIVTLNYGYDQEKHALYFHSAPEGLKIEFLRDNPNVCGTVIENKGYIMGECEHHYRSVVFWGSMSVVESLAEKKHGMDIMLHHLEAQPDAVKERILKNDKTYRKLGIFRLDIHEISGKEGQ